jgi:hypothetical protein
MDSAIKTISSLFALASFAIALVAGILAQNTPATILSNALICMVLCRILGWFLGAAAVRVSEAELRAYHAANPIPDVSAALSISTSQPEAPSDDPVLSTKTSQST